MPGALLVVLLAIVIAVIKYPSVLRMLPDAKQGLHTAGICAGGCKKDARGVAGGAAGTSGGGHTVPLRAAHATLWAQRAARDLAKLGRMEKRFDISWIM